MKGRYLKIFLPAIIGILTALSLVVLPSKVHAQTANTGSISVCKVIADPSGSVFDGSTMAGVTFTIPGITPVQTSQPPAIGQIPDSVFTTPTVFNADILGNDGKDDSQCVTYSNLVIGSYYYGEETISPSANWKTPLYNDQFTVQAFSLADFFSYDPNLFDGNAGNDGSRNQNADGHIILTQNRPDRTLVVLNQLSLGPSVGGGPNISGNISTPQCPANGPQQIDQVWFSDIKPGEVTVHWANKGDAQGFHIAYGPAQNNLIWGVEVNDPKANEYTLKNLPAGDLWVSVIAKASQDCGGPGSDPKVVGAVSGGPQVLGATGIAILAILSLVGLILIAAGLWQAQSALVKRSRG